MSNNSIFCAIFCFVLQKSLPAHSEMKWNCQWWKQFVSVLWLYVNCFYFVIFILSLLAWVVELVESIQRRSWEWVNRYNRHAHTTTIKTHSCKRILMLGFIEQRNVCFMHNKSKEKRNYIPASSIYNVMNIYCVCTSLLLPVERT